MRHVVIACLAPSLWFTASIASERIGAAASFPSPPLKTGQTACWDSQGKTVDCAGTGQDGELQAGVSADPRFKDNQDGTITDTVTGLMWLKDAGCFGDQNWDSAVISVATLAAGRCGLSDGSAPGDWRIPNFRELQSLIDYGTEWPAVQRNYPFLNIDPTKPYLSSTNLPVHYMTRRAFTIDTFSVRAILFHSGWSADCWIGEEAERDCTAWPIRKRSVEPHSGARLPKTGQTECRNSKRKRIDCVGTGQDGEYQAGASVDSRFAENNDGTVTDRLTGLVWLKNADCWGKRDWETSLKWTRGLQNGKCGLEDGSLPGDWRMPNVREIESVIDYATSRPSSTLRQVFPTLRTGHVDFYWSSTTSVGFLDSVWAFLPTSGDLSRPEKTSAHYTWPVRGGRVGPGPVIATTEPETTAVTSVSELPDPGVLPKDPTTGKILFQSLVPVEGLSASTLYGRAIFWVSGTLRSGRSCVRRDDEEAGQVHVEAYLPVHRTGADAPIRYLLAVEVEEGAFRWTLSDFVQVATDGELPFEQWRGVTAEKTRITHIRIAAWVKHNIRNLEYNMTHGSLWPSPPPLPRCKPAETVPGPS